MTDWASLNTSLVWAYNGTYSLGGNDELTEPTQIAAWLVRRGRAKVITDAGSVSAREGEWLLPGRAPRRQVFSDDALLLSVNFTATWPDGRWLFPGERPVMFPSSLNPRLTRESMRLVRYVTTQFGARGVSLRLRTLSLSDFLGLERQFFAWLGLLVRTAESVGLEIAEPSSTDTRVIYALRYLHRWPIGEPFRETILARHSGLSAVHLNRLFLKGVGVSPRAYHERCRLERGKALLRDPGRSIKEVAADLGFSSPAYFSAWFRRLCAHPPTAHRRRVHL